MYRNLLLRNRICWFSIFESNPAFSILVSSVNSSVTRMGVFPGMREFFPRLGQCNGGRTMLYKMSNILGKVLQ